MASAELALTGSRPDGRAPQVRLKEAQALNNLVTGVDVERVPNLPRQRSSENC